ncbi:hypothetical protein HPB50_000419 [Hyalomma asiaticum]|uniref:Uncharacterized protein n=1 Tax=Hyalomma asiaticum TaxID=266040 RepID=A0ACB7RS52_HYAAI|nr:hypothetical protein HPB50_000419 [Hyalomma asiaticum]
MKVHLGNGGEGDARTGHEEARRDTCCCVGVLLSTRLEALQEAGCTISLHWIPSHVGLPGNEAADALAKEAHAKNSPLSSAVTAGDFTRIRLLRHLRTYHPDKRIALGSPPRPLPQSRLERRATSLLLCLRVGCHRTAARLFRQGRTPSPNCSSCGEEETLEHLLLRCPAHSLHRLDMLRVYRNMGLPCATQEHLLFPGSHQEQALRSLLGFLDASGLSSSL